jgi:integrase/recombinase XerC
MVSQILLESVMEKIETLEQGLAFFETVGMPARSLAARTRQEYRDDLTDLITFLNKRGITTLAQMGLQDLEQYQAEMDRRGYKPATRRRKTSAIKSWFEFLHRQNVINNNIASRLIRPKLQEREPRFLSKEEYQRLLRACSHKPRDAAMIEVLLQTGMRLSELAGLQIGDIALPKRITKDPENTGSVRVRRKGGKVNTIPLNYKACQALAAWLKVRPQVDHGGLFVTKFKTAIGKRAIQYTVAKYLLEANIEGASVHTMRHTMATHHVAAGTDLKTVQTTLDHASLATTTRYVSLAKEAQRQALQEHAL